MARKAAAPASQQDKATTTGSTASAEDTKPKTDEKDDTNSTATSTDQPDSSAPGTENVGDAVPKAQEHDSTDDQGDGDSAAGDGEPAPSDKLRDEQAEIDAAVEENPEAPEEAVETKYLVGGEIPVGAPGTEGLPRA